MRPATTQRWTPSSHSCRKTFRTASGGGPAKNSASQSAPGSRERTTRAADKRDWADCPHRIRDHHEPGREPRSLTPPLSPNRAEVPFVCGTEFCVPLGHFHAAVQCPRRAITILPKIYIVKGVASLRRSSAAAGEINLDKVAWFGTLNQWLSDHIQAYQGLSIDNLAFHGLKRSSGINQNHSGSRLQCTV